MAQLDVPMRNLKRTLTFTSAEASDAKPASLGSSGRQRRPTVFIQNQDTENQSRAAQRLTASQVMQVVKFIWFVTFLAVFSLTMIYSRPNQASYLMNRYIDEPFSQDVSFFEKAYTDITNTEDAWAFLRGPLISGLFTDISSVGAELPRRNNMIYSTTTLVGYVRMRQVRVRYDLSCGHLRSALRQMAGPCVPKYSTEMESTASYGPGNMFTYSSPAQTGVGRTRAGIYSYGGGGFVEDLTPDFNATATRMASLQANNWIDDQTRLVVIDWTLYNGNVNLFHVGRLYLEWLPSGGVHPSKHFRVYNLFRYSGYSGMSLMILEIVLLFYILYYIGEEFVEFFGDPIAYLTLDYWNWVDTLNDWLFISVICIRITFLVRLSRLDFSQPNQFFNMHAIGVLQVTETNLLAVNAILLYIKIFKFSTFALKSQLIVTVIRVAFAELLTFLVMMLLVVAGFSFAGFLAFGATVDGFYSPIRSLGTLFQFALGNFDLESLLDDNHWFASMYFSLYIIVVVFVILSMFVAIVSDTYNDVRDDLDQVRKASVSSLLWRKLEKKMAGVPLLGACVRRKAERDVREFAEDLAANANLNKDKVWTREEVARVLRRHDVDDDFEDIDDLFGYFDINADDKLDANEQAVLLDYLQRKALDPNTPLPVLPRRKGTMATLARRATAASAAGAASPDRLLATRLAALEDIVHSQLSALANALARVESRLAAQPAQPEQPAQPAQAPVSKAPDNKAAPHPAELRLAESHPPGSRPTSIALSRRASLGPDPHALPGLPDVPGARPARAPTPAAAESSSCSSSPTTAGSEAE